MSSNQFDSLKGKKVIKEGRFSDKVAFILSTWFGVGFLPRAPGTFGTAGAIPLYVAGNVLGPGYQLFFLLIIIIGAIWASQRITNICGLVDPNEIVIDEVAGFLLTTVFLPFTWSTFIAGFFLFRFFDILKPPPIKKIEQRVKGGFGVVFDDLLAGIYAHICLRLLLSILG